MPSREEIRRLLILRPDHLGDLVLFSGALKHFRRLWPDAHVSLCVRKHGLELFAHCPYVDELISYDTLSMDACGQGRLSWMPAIIGSDRLGKILREKFPSIVGHAYRSDLAVMPLLAPHYFYHKCMEGIPARDRVGIGGNHTNQSAESELESRRIYTSQMDAAHLPWNFSEMEVTRLFLEFLGAKPGVQNLWPEFWTTREDCRRAGELIPQSEGKICLGIAPAVSSIAAKELPAKWFAEMTNLLAFDNFQVVLFGSQAETDVCEETAWAIAGVKRSGGVVNLAGKTSVREMIECIRRCDLVISQETAALHIATTLRKPVIGIVGGGHFGRFYPWGDPKLSRVVNQPMDCYGCNWQCKFETIRCIQGISPVAAARALNELHAGL